MVRSSPGIKLFLVLVTVMLSVVTMAPSLPILSPQKELQDDDSGPGSRVERSTNLSRITGSARKIRMFIRNKYLQMFTDGTVNVTDDGSSDYTILQRTSVNRGQVKIQGVATCTFLCMDSCGYLYSTREFSDECVFNELLERHYYNTYSSTKYSNSKRTLYLAIGKGDVPCRVQIKANTTLGKKSAFTEVLPQPVEDKHLELLENRLLAMYPNVPHHSLRHHQLCPPSHHASINMSVKCLKSPKKKKRRRGGEHDDNEDSSLLLQEGKSGGKRKSDAEDDHSMKKGDKRKRDGKKAPKSWTSKLTDGSSMDEEETVTTAVSENAKDEFSRDDN